MTKSPVKIAVVMACYNRRETTLRCLRSLSAQATDDIALEIHLLDDASADGTAAAVAAAFPKVRLLQGTGSLFWGGGMRVAMQSALNAPFDFMLWLNDDVELKADAIPVLLEADATARALTGVECNIIVGAMQEPATEKISYSGFNRRNRWHAGQLVRVVPSGTELTPCDTLNGNLVLVPNAVVEAIGLIDRAFPHQLGDIDYGFRLNRAGGHVFLAPGTIGFCASNPPSKAAASIRGRLRQLRSPRGLPFKAWSTFLWRYSGPLSIPLLFAMYVRAILGTYAR